MADDMAAIPAGEQRYVGGYLLLRPLGKGSFGTVMLARHLVTGTHVAIKIVPKEASPSAFQEFGCLKSLDHPNITQLFEFIETKEKHYLVMEHVPGGNLLEHLQSCGPASEEEARRLFRQLLAAVQHCHQRGIVHRDLKLENVLLDQEGNVKLADFGLSVPYSGGLLNTFRGTVAYMAPEVLRRQAYDGLKADIWSLGVFLYEMQTGHLPFIGKNLKEMKKKVGRGCFHIPYSFSDGCRHLIKKILDPDPSHRPTLEDLLEDPWVKAGQEGDLKLSREPPRDDLDPQVTQLMQNLGFSLAKIKEKMKERNFDSTMGCYQVLVATKSKWKAGREAERPSPSPRPSCKCPTPLLPSVSAPSSKEVVLSVHLPYLETTASSPHGSMHSGGTGPPRSRVSSVAFTPSCVVASMAGPPASIQARVAMHPTTAEVPQHDLGGTSSRSHGAPRASSNETPGGRTQGPSRGHRQGRPTRFKRVLNFITEMCCCGPSTRKKHQRRPRIHPR